MGCVLSQQKLVLGDSGSHSSNMEFNSSGEMKVKCSKIKAAVRSSACSQRSSGRNMDDLQDLRSSRANRSTEVSVTVRMSLCVCFQWISLMNSMEDFVVYDLGHMNMQLLILSPVWHHELFRVGTYPFHIIHDSSVRRF